MLTRRDILQQAGRTAAILATTAPWWLVRRAHAARDKKLVVWTTTALAPQVDKIMQEQCYAYAKQAGIKESEIDYSISPFAQSISTILNFKQPMCAFSETNPKCAFWSQHGATYAATS